MAQVDDERSRRINAALSILRRLPVNETDACLNGLVNLMPEEADELLQRVDVSLMSVEDEEEGKSFLICDYNRDGDSHRSPWSNSYFPPLEDGEDGWTPKPELRALEKEANNVFDEYRKMLFGPEGSISSVYLWDHEEPEDGAADSSTGGFCGCYLVKKNVGGTQGVDNGCWNSIHVVEVNRGSTDEKGRVEYLYTVTTTLILNLTVKDPKFGDANWGAQVVRQSKSNNFLDSKIGEDAGPYSSSHLESLGQLLERSEIDLRSNVKELYIDKTK